MATNRLRVTDLDFDQIKENLKDFLRSQSEFQDYDFEGSGMSVLIDLLAYNTHYNALYTNLAVNEMFLDSASKRSSVVSIANNFGYTPISSTASKAMLNITVTQQNAVDPIKFTLGEKHQQKYLKKEGIPEFEQIAVTAGTQSFLETQDDSEIKACSLDDPDCLMWGS
jgi:hypothetical protein